MIRLAVRCHVDEAELALAELVELAPSGIEEVRDGDFVEYAVYGPPGELPELHDIQVAVGDALVEISTTEVPDDWNERWKTFHRPVLVGGKLYVRPSWEPASGHPDTTEVVIDPGQAFGTGSHATTKLCLELLLQLPPGGELVDLGCGSGLLAIAAGKLGFSPLRCYDFDQLAVDATLINAAANKIKLKVEKSDLREALPPLAPTVVANLMRPLLLKVASQMAAQPTPPATNLILSGLMDEEADEISATYSQLDLTEKSRKSNAGWTALLLTPRPT